MAEKLDPEEVMEVMNGAFEVLIEPICRYEGTVARLMGDAIVAFFGAPIAHEDDAERACRAALEIIEGAQRYAARLEHERGIHGFNVRVGVNTGLVVVGEVGSDLHVEYTAMGDAVNLAARMESAAEPGTVLITEETHKLIAPLFETQSLGPIAVKGKAEPVAVYRVLGPKAAAGKPRGLAGLASPLVGRQAEVGALQEALARLQAGLGGIVTLVGEAGIGKSRLVAELRKSVPASQVQWVEGQCLSYGTSIAYLLWLDALRSVLGMSVEDPPAAVRDALRQWVRNLCPQRLDDVYPYLARLMSLPLEANDEARMRNLEAERLKAQTFCAVEILVACAASIRPLVLVCEDLHWADPTSLELLERMLAVTDRAALLFICVFRPQKEHGSWRIKETAARTYGHRHTDLWLDPLSAADSQTLVNNLLSVEGVPVQLIERILAVAEGNPFYVEEVIRSLIDAGAIIHDEATGRWHATRAGADLPIPDTLQGVLIARIDRLPEETQCVLQMAAVIGRIFLYRVLAAMVEEECRLDEHLITLQREEMIRERARIPELEYIFKHELTRETAYNGLLKKDRQAFHRQVAEAMERLFPDRIEEQVELLAHHWGRAEEPEKATNYLLQAGDRARRLGASLEAVDLYQSALEKAMGLKVPPKGIELPGIHERLGDVYLENLSRHEQALEHYKSFLDLAESEEDRARGARKVATVCLLRGDVATAEKYYGRALTHLGSLPSVAEASRVHCGLAYLLISRNQLDDALRHAGTSLEISRPIADTRGLADAYRAMGIIAVQKWDLDSACEYDQRSLELYRELGDLARTAQAHNNVGDSYRLLGQMDRALEQLDEGLEVARRIGDTRDEALLLQTMAELFLDQGRWEEAIAHLEQALPLAQESGVVGRLIDVQRILGSAYEAVGRPEEGRHHLEVAETRMQETQQFRFAPRLYLDLAHLHATQGRFEEALSCIQLALTTAGPAPSDAFLGLVHGCYGYVYDRRGNWDEAVSHLEHSLRLLERANVPSEVGRTRLSLGTAYANRNGEGDRGRACQQVLAALSVFHQIGARGYLTQAEARLEELGGQPPNSDASLKGERSAARRDR